MPRLLLFAMCQKAIIDRDESVVSMIALLTSIAVKPQDGTFEPDAVIPFPWATISLWLRTPEDEDKTFEQRMSVVSPSGKISGETTVSFTMSGRNHQNKVAGSGFPVGEAGEYKLQLWLREVGEGNEWKMVSEYPFEIVHAT